MAPRAIRNELEKQQIDKEERIQEAKAALTNEIIQLKETVGAERETMTANMITYEEKLQESKQIAQNEINQLKETIAVLRDQLEECNGK